MSSYAMVKHITPPEPPQLIALKSVLQRVCEKYPVARLQSFSFSSQTESASPLTGEMDLLVEYLPNSEPGLVEMGALREDLEQQLGCRVELLSRQAVERSINSYRRRTILANPVTLYAR